MKIGLVLPSVPGYSETFFLNKIKGLEANGYSVILFVNSYSDVNITTKIKVAPELSENLIGLLLLSFYKLLYSLFFHFRASKHLFMLDRADGVVFFQRLKNIINNSHIISESIDWLHFGFGTMAINRENVAKAIGAKMAVSFRGFDISIYPVKNPDCYKKLWTKVDKIHVISDDISDLVFKHGFNGQIPIIRITPAIDTTLFKNEIKDLSTTKINFVTIARLHWKKGLEYTLEALSLLKQEGVSFHYTIIGEGEEYERLKFAAYQLGITDCVTFTGRISHKSVKKRLEQASIYLQYSIQEGFCNAVLEAQAMGLLCIVSDAEGLSENVLNKVTGFIVPMRNSISLANKIKEVLQMRNDEIKVIKINSISRVVKEFNLSSQIKEFVTFYEEN